jgi:Sulfatase
MTRHLLLFVLLSCLPPSAFASPPSVLLILADDLGVECLSAYGGTSHRTPNLDRLANEGMRFTHCFSNPFCSPSRGQLLTGRYPFRNGLKVVLHSKNQEGIYLHPAKPVENLSPEEEGAARKILQAALDGLEK